MIEVKPVNPEEARPEWGRELRALVTLAVPVVLSELGWMAQGVVDTIMVGKLGPAAIGAVALGNAVFYTPSLFGIGLLLGLDTLVSQSYGRKDYDGCHRWLAQGVYLARLWRRSPWSWWRSPASFSRGSALGRRLLLLRRAICGF